MPVRRSRSYTRDIVGRMRPRRHISLPPLALIVLLLIAAGIGVLGDRVWLDQQRTAAPTEPGPAPGTGAGGTGTPSSPETGQPTDGQPPTQPTSRDPWEDARLRGVTFRGVGQEPGWAVEIVRGQSIYFLFDYGQSSVTATMATGESGASAGATVYKADSPTFQLSVAVEDKPCVDSMSGQEYPNTVTVTFNGTAFRGCGRPLT